MNRFEHACHTARRDEGELSVDRVDELWAESQIDMLGEAVEVTDGYRSWWSYVPTSWAAPATSTHTSTPTVSSLHCRSTPLTRPRATRSFPPTSTCCARRIEDPEELRAIVGCDLADPGFWTDGQKIVDAQLTAAEDEARAAGRL
jgi:oligoendopeptidase F